MTESIATPQITELALMQLTPPESVAMWPDTIAWKVLFAIIVIAVVITLWRCYQNHKKALWRRQALALAEQAKQQAQAGIWFALIKRVHLVHHRKKALAARTDEQLLSVLTDLDSQTRHELIQAHYQKDSALSAKINQAIYHFVISWVKALPIESTQKGVKDNEASVNHV